MTKEPFVSKEQLEEIVKKYPTPFHLYDEKGIRANAEAVKEAFSWNKGYKEYFAVKATPTPAILQILKEEGYDYSYIHYTYLAPWYERLGYKTVIKWNRDGIL